MSYGCSSCDDAIAEDPPNEIDGAYYCQQCHDELTLGIIVDPAAVMGLDDEQSDDDDTDDDAVGSFDNAVRSYEDDMPDVEQYGWRDTTLDDGPTWPHGYQ